MILAIPYSHVDLEAALRLVKWLGFLSDQHHQSMKKETLLLVSSIPASLRSSHKEIIHRANEIFGRVLTYTPETEYELGWPGACNFMMKETLEFVEKYHKDDIFLLEPDATPLTWGWWDMIRDEWEIAEGKHFLGQYLPKDIPHMSGIGVYGRNWRSVAPKLAQVQNRRGWDTFASDQMIPHVAFSNLIHHHQWITSASNYHDFTLADINEYAVIFHQDKEGRVIKMLDDQYYGGAGEKAYGFSKLETNKKVTMKWFMNLNLNRQLSHLGVELLFDPLDQLGGTWRGILATEDEKELMALESLIKDPMSAVREITKEEYDDRTKKKARTQTDYADLIPLSPRVQKAQITAVPAEVVEEPAAVAPISDISGPVQTDNIEKVIQVGKVKPPEHVMSSKASHHSKSKTKKKK